MMNKKGFTATNYVIGIVIFSTIIALSVIMVGGLATDYGNEDIVDAEFSEHYDRLNEHTSMIDDSLSEISSDQGFSLIGSSFELLFKSTLSVLLLIVDSLGIFASQIIHIGEDFGIPTQVTRIMVLTFLAIVTIGVVFIVLNAVNKQKPL